MFGIGSTELLVILVVALIVLGPKNLAGAARTLGKFMGEFKKVSRDFQRTLNAEAAAEEMRQAKTTTPETETSKTMPKSERPSPQNDTPLAEALEKARIKANETDRDKA